MSRLIPSLLGTLILAHLASAAPPNVIVILADDQGWGDLSIHGNTNLKTPHVDSLARDGARFDRFFVQPVCSPTRAEFLTGRYHPRGGVTGVSTGQERLDPDERTIADAFRKAGYATGCFGKWHNGTQYPYHPLARGFDEYYGFTSGHWADYFDSPLDHNGKDVQGQGYITDDLTTHGIEFFEKAAKAGKPFFCYLAYNTPHSPMQVPDPYWNRFEKSDLKLTGSKKENLNHTRAVLAMCENIDDNVGRVLMALKKAKLEENTIVVYFSDNGPNGHRWNGDMKGIKGSTDEGGVRSPLHIRWPGHIVPNTVVSQIAGAIDLMPTLLSMASVKRVNEKPLDGMNLAPWFRAETPAPPDRVLFQHWAGRVTARSQRFRLDATGKLFDMLADPSQTKDVTKDHPKEAKQLTDAVKKWKQEVLAEASKAKERPFTAGHAEMPRSVLPARDGVPHAGVKRSANAPNCSYFTNWTTPKDSMTWEIEVATSGKYEAIVRYTCPKDDLGSDIELKWNEAKWSGKTSVAFESPLRGKNLDRVPRGAESLMKDFRPLSLGIVELSKGRGVLTLRANKVTGKEVADVRSVELILKE